MDHLFLDVYGEAVLGSDTRGRMGSSRDAAYRNVGGVNHVERGGPVLVFFLFHANRTQVASPCIRGDLIKRSILPVFCFLLLSVWGPGCKLKEVNGRVHLYRSDCLQVTSGNLIPDVGSGFLSIAGLAASVPDGCDELITSFYFGVFCDANNNGRQDPGDNLEFLEDGGAPTALIELGDLEAQWTVGGGVIRWESRSLRRMDEFFLAGGGYAMGDDLRGASASDGRKEVGMP